MQQPILTFHKVKDNVLDYDIIEIISFNYDGEGNALTFCFSKEDKEKSLMSFKGADLDIILFGGLSGEIYYKPVLS